jgi:adenosine deaminase
MNLRLLAATLLLAALPLAARPSRCQTPSEFRTAHALDAAKKLGPTAVYAFLRPMPKGGDLHMHLSGAVYAETFIAEAVKENLCIDPTALRFDQRSVPAGAKEGTAPNCGTHDVPASTALLDQHLYDELIDSFSMRAFVPSEGVTGHDQFFATFDRFGGLHNESGAWLDEVATRAASQNEQYLEIMTTPPFSKAATLGYKLGWPGGEGNVSREELAKLRDQLLAAGLRDEVADDLANIADAEATRNKLEHCESADPKPACKVTVHWLYQVLRAFPPQQVFAQTLLGFEAISAGKGFVGINFVQPEDARVAMKDYHLQMQMLDYLHSVYPHVKIALHAGELTLGLVPPAGLNFHIRQAINLGHASRIGHGVDVLYEKDPSALLKEMSEKHIMVEINLTSNDGILGIKGADHPLHAYLAAHVPVALSTDDEGVSRIDITHEYARAATEQSLTYLDLKRMARTSLEHAFFQGADLWAHPDDFTGRVSACLAPITANSQPAPACAAYLANNERAAQQYELERRLAAFEATIH